MSDAKAKTKKLILHTDEATGLSIIVFDELNFAITKPGEQKVAGYYARLDSAVKALSRMVAATDATDLKTWLATYEKTSRQIVEKFDSITTMHYDSRVIQPREGTNPHKSVSQGISTTTEASA